MAADIVLKLDQGSGRQSIPATGAVRRVRVPAGTRTLSVNSPLPFYWEKTKVSPLGSDSAAKADAAAEDTTMQFRFEAGNYGIPLAGNGETDIPFPQLPYDVFFYFAGTAAAQDISFFASSIP